MRGKGTADVQKLQRDVRRAQEHIDSRELDEARGLLLQVRKECQARGLRTVQVPWMLAIVGDYSGDLDMAVQSIQEAVRTDPLSQPVLRSFDIISGRIRGYLTAADRPADAEDTPKLYGLLQELGEADLACHLVMARWEAQTGKPDAALRRVDAVLLLFPYSHEAWALKAGVAGLLGDADAQRAAEVEAAALGGVDRGPLPFTMPGLAEG
jgi:tetratricopeptide (TPR) repeat protein